MWALIPIIAILIGGAIPITAILTSHKRNQTKLQIKLIEKEMELEKLRLETFESETEKMRLELEHSKQMLIETRKP